MESLSEYERSVLMDLELSLLGESRRPLRLAVLREYEMRRRQVAWSASTFILATALTTIFLTRVFLVSLTGLALMIASSLLFAQNAPLLRRASRMLRPPRFDERPSGPYR